MAYWDSNMEALPCPALRPQICSRAYIWVHLVLGARPLHMSLRSQLGQDMGRLPAGRWGEAQEPADR